MRNSLGLGKHADELLEICQKFDVRTELNDLLAIDYFFGQQDRHSKNIGFVGSKLSPIYDSGACLYFDVADGMLAAVDIARIQNHKTFAKPLSELIDFSFRHICSDFSFNKDVSYLKAAFEHAHGSLMRHYSRKRFDFIKKFVFCRIDMFSQLLNCYKLQLSTA